MTYDVTFCVSFPSVSLLSEFSIGTLKLNGKFLLPDLIWHVPLASQMPAFQFILCRHACTPLSSFLSSYDRIITHVRTLSLAVGKCAVGLQGSRDARERRYRRA